MGNQPMGCQMSCSVSEQILVFSPDSQVEGKKSLAGNYTSNDKVFSLCDGQGAVRFSVL